MVLGITVLRHRGYVYLAMESHIRSNRPQTRTFGRGSRSLHLNDLFRSFKDIYISCVEVRDWANPIYSYLFSC